MTPVSIAHGTAVSLHEWERLPHDPDRFLTGVTLPDDTATVQLLTDLARKGMVEVDAYRKGLAIQATSFVGRIGIGDLTITIQPKIKGMPLLRLLRYAYGLRDLALMESTEHALATLAFQDLLIHQLAAEAQELLARGVRREYRREDGYLASPRGRLDVNRLAREGGFVRGALPCISFPRSENCLVNQVLLAGIRLASGLTADLRLRTELRRLRQVLEETVTPARLDRATLHAARRSQTRLTAAYRPALVLVELLVQTQGIALEDTEEQVALPGFLFDMNRFFQALLSRFLTEHLPGYSFRDEYRLRGMLTYSPYHNPRNRRAPEPRPDYVVLRGQEIVAILDAKYRDLWNRSLPRDMLYQLVIYALSRDHPREATILFPVVEADAREARVVVHDPLDGNIRAHVTLRPVNLLALDELLSDASVAGRDHRQGMAAALAFGDHQPRAVRQRTHRTS